MEKTYEIKGMTCVICKANIEKALNDDTFITYGKNSRGETIIVSQEITAVAIPLDIKLPEWLEPFIDYDTILADNLNGFPYESIGISRLQRNTNCTNILQL